MRAWLVVLVLVLVVPLLALNVVGQGDGVTVRHYLVYMDSQGVGAGLGNFSIDPTPFQFGNIDTARSRTMVELQAYTSSDSQTLNTRLDIRWGVDGENLITASDCGTRVTAINIPGSSTGSAAGAGESRIKCTLVDYRDAVFTVEPEVEDDNNNNGAHVGLKVWNTDVIISSFQGGIGMSALEFMVAPVLTFIGAILWSRSTDGVLRIIGGLLPVIGGLVLFSVGFEAGFGDSWIALVAVMTILMVVGVYMIIRAMIDQFQEVQA